MYRLLPGLLGLALLGLTACGEPPGSSPSPRPDAAADSAFAQLARLDADAVAEAYARLHAEPFVAELRLEVLDPEGAVTDFAARTVQVTPEGQTVLAADSSGAFPGGGTFAGLLHVANPLPRVLPDDPAYRSPRTREQYRYAARDTLLDGRRLRVLEATLRPDADGEQAVRGARYVVAPDAGRLRAVEVYRASTSVLFDESSRVTVALQPGGRLPARAVAETVVDVPGHGPRRLRLTQAFPDPAGQELLQTGRLTLLK